MLRFHLETCKFNHSIGLEDGTFDEKGLIASTFLDVYHSPNWARLNQPSSWAPALLRDTLRLQQFVQITFVDGPYLVTGISVQGSPLEDWWVTKFQIATSKDAQHLYKNPQVIALVLLIKVTLSFLFSHVKLSLFK